ncbi:MAG: arginine--tRNA ligase [Acholeplasmatales bacterium]|nr:arginine--tRNA ligase [Acholeplasmatales bacterium]
MIDDIKQTLKKGLEAYYNEKYGISLNLTIEEPKKASMGDISVPMFLVVKELKKPMPEVVSEAVEVIKGLSPFIKEVNPTGPFINIIVDKGVVAEAVLKNVYDKKDSYGDSNVGNGHTIVLDYSSPNIAKSFSIGHLRSTMIGNSLKLIFQKAGYKTVGIDYLGDWGTQFGKMIVAYEMWGDDEAIKRDPINELSKLYVRFNTEAEDKPEMDEQAREAFRKIELGDPKYVALWKWIREESLKESQQIYDLLGVTFDSYNGEAYYNDKMDPVVEELEEKGLLKEDQGAQIVELGDDLPPALIKRSDGGSLYITRDLAAVFDRMKCYNFDKCLYVVGNEQKLHFTQLKTVLKKMGYDYGDRIEHINFGLYLTGGTKMSTRKGNVVKLYDVLMDAIAQARKQIEEKNPNIENKDDIARKVGIGAIVFNDLKNHRTNDIEFNLESMLKFEGQTGPYLQYTGVRIFSIVDGQELDLDNICKDRFNEPHYFELIKLISAFKTTVERATVEFAPSVVAKYLLSLAQSFNGFYAKEKINAEDKAVRNTNMILAGAVRVVINEGLRLLGMDYVNKM